VISFNAMMPVMSQVPMKLIVAAVVGLTAAAFLTGFLGWHAVRRLLDVPRLTRPAAMYVALGALWSGAALLGLMSVAAIFLMRDHQRIDAPTALAEVRCEAVGADHVRVELRTSLVAPPERYDLPGNTCTVSVRQLELRPVVGVLAAPVLSRVEGVGPIPRPASGPRWITPGGRLVDLVARRSEAIQVAVPVDAQVHSVLVSGVAGPTLTGPTLTNNRM
jgi:hypothetical protein